MTTGSTLSRLGQRSIPVLVTVFLFFVPQLSALDSVRNRYFLFWGRRDTLAICTAILLLSGLSILLGAMVDRSGIRALMTGRDILFLTVFGVAVSVNLLGLLHVRVLMDFLKRNSGLTRQELWFAMGAFGIVWIVGIALWRPVMLRVVRGACFILSPIFITVLGPALFWTRWDIPPDPIPARHAESRAGTPIYFLVFDEWSYARSTQDGEFLDDLPRLRELRERSFFFRHASSPADDTYRSLPETLFQSRDFESLPSVFVSRGRDVPRAEARVEFATPMAGDDGPQSLFALARQNSYQTYMLGFYLPYGAILGNQVAVCRAYSDYPKAVSFPARVALRTIQSPQYWHVPLLSDLWKRLYAPVFSRNWVRLVERFREDLFQVIDSAQRRSFVFVHYPVPHAPFVFEADGSYRGPFHVNSSTNEDIDEDIMAGTPEDYRRSLRHLDSIVGRIVGRLEEQGLFDDALLILTSDHSWRTDPALGDQGTHGSVRHVPLLIKLPGQRRPHTVEDPTDIVALRPIIEQALRGTLDEKHAAALFACEHTPRPGAS